MSEGANHPVPACAVNPPPKPHRRSKLPLEVGTLERILGAARTQPDRLEGVPAGRWWLALLLAIIDTGHDAARLLRLGRDAYRPNEGTLRSGKAIYPLHAHTSAALEAIRHYARQKLFPWPKDGGMLYHDYRSILHRAGLPATEPYAIKRLRSTAVETPEILDCIDPWRPFFPVAGRPHQQRKRKEESRAKKYPVIDPAAVYLIGDDSPRTLKRFFAETYAPLRLTGRSPHTLGKFRTTIKLFSDFVACDATLDHLTEDRLDDFKVWLLERVSAATVNGKLRELLALWRYAWKKRKVGELPRDVEFLAEIKRLPVAWSQEEMAGLLQAAGETEGEICNLPARQWWPALILTLYDSGLRIQALLELESQFLDLETGWIRIPGETQKQKADQVFRLHVETIAALKAIYPDRRERVFNWHYVTRAKTLYRPFDEILERAGLPTTAKDKFHKIRRTSATYLADATSAEEAQKHMGHSHISVTRAYLDPTKMTRRMAASDVMPRPEWKPKTA